MLASCKFWHQPIRGYFEEWTSECSIAKYELDGIESYTDKDGNLCIASDHDVPVNLYLINPYHYYIPSDKITPPTGGIISGVSQDSGDTTVLHFTYSKDDLVNNEGGGEIGGKITVTHPMNLTPRDFTFSLKCNSRPPEVIGAMVQKYNDNGTSKFVICFYMPNELGSNRHNKENHALYIGENKVAYGKLADLLSGHTTVPNGFTKLADDVIFDTDAPDGYTTFFYPTGEGDLSKVSNMKIKLVDDAGLSSRGATPKTSAVKLTLIGNKTTVKGTPLEFTPSFDSTGVTVTKYEVTSTPANSATGTFDSDSGKIKVTPNNTGNATITVKAILADGSISTADPITIRALDVYFPGINTSKVMFVDGEDVTLTPTQEGFPSDFTPTYTWTSSDESVATVSNGVVVAKDTGTATITVSATYDGATASAQKTVYVCKCSELQGYDFTLLGDSNTFNLKLKIDKPDVLNDSIQCQTSSEKPTVATIDETDKYLEWKITPKKAGKTKISVKVTIGGTDYTVTKDITIYDLKITGNPLINKSGSAAEFTAKLYNGSSNLNPLEGMTISWEKGNSDCASMTSSGNTCTLTPKNAGSFNLKVQAKINSKVLMKTQTIYVIGWSGDTNFITGESSRTLTVTPASGLTYTWKSSDPTVATVDDSGKITAKSGGEANIELTAKLSSSTSSIKITIPINVYDFTISGNPLLGKGGSYTTLTATVKKGSTLYSGATLTYEWSPGSTSIATCNANNESAKISPVAGGTTDITVKLKRNGTQIATKTYKVYVIDVSGLTTFIKGEEPRALKVTPANDSDLTYLWDSDNTNKAEVDSTGLITAKAKGSPTITLKVKKGSYEVSLYNSISISEITFTGLPTEIAVGEKYDCTYSFNPTCSFTAGISPSSSSKVDCSFGSSNTNLIFEGLATGPETFTLKLTKDGTTIEYKLPTITVVTAHSVSISDLDTWLSSQPVNSKDKPYKLNITGLNASNTKNDNETNIKDNTLRKYLKNNPTKYVDLSGTTIPGSVTDLSCAFCGCTTLVKAPTISSGVTSLDTCFQGCTNLTDVPAIPSSVDDMNYAFKGCTSLKKVTIAYNSTRDSLGTFDLWGYAFNGCTSFQTLTVTGVPSGKQSDVKTYISGSAEIGITASQITCN